MKTIYQYNNYREFVKDRFEEMRAKDPKISHRSLVAKCGFRSSNTIHLIITGKRNLTKDSAQKLAKGLELSADEAKYFAHLTLLNQTDSLDEKIELTKKLTGQKTFQSRLHLSGELLHYYQQWYYPIIREMIGLPDFQQDPQWIADRLGHGITPDDVKAALKELEKLNLILRDTQGSLKQSDTHLKASGDVPSSVIAHFHYEMMKKAGESVTSTPREQRDLSSITLAIPHSKIPEFRKMISVFQEEVIELAENQAGDDKEIYQLNVQLFPLTKKSSDEAA